MQVSVKNMLAMGALAALSIPPAVFLWAAYGAGLTTGETMSALAAQYVAPRQNLLVCGALGLFPLALLAGVLWLLRRLAPSSKIRPALALGGLVPVLVVLVWVNVDFWPLFLPSRTYPGFPHGLGFIIGPGFFAPVAMAIGMLASWLVSRRNA